MAQPRSLVGDVFERNVAKKPISPPATRGISNKNGFPSVQHRSKSAFAKAREARNGGPSSSRPTDVPVVQSALKVEPDQKENGASTSMSATAKPDLPLTGDWKEQISRENEMRVAAMTDEEREQERAELLEHFGPGLDTMMRKIMENGANSVRRSRAEPMTPTTPQTSRPQSPSRRHVSILRSNSPPGSRSSTPRGDRKLRFADVTAEDVHVYESEPPSPKQPLLLLPPTEDDAKDPSVTRLEAKISLPPQKASDSSVAIAKVSDAHIPTPSVHPVMDEHNRISGAKGEPEPEEGTPEYIRRRFFPHIPPGDPSLEWIEGASGETDLSDPNAPRFDLAGRIIPPSQRSVLPTHLGLHHHAGHQAGYTLDDIFLLSRSTVPAQRTTMIAVLGKIIRGLSLAQTDKAAASQLQELKGKEEGIRKRAMAAGLEAIDQKGSLGLVAVDLAWACIVEWDVRTIGDIHGIELRTPNIADALPPSVLENTEKGKEKDQDLSTMPGHPIDNIPIEYLLVSMSRHFATADLPPESLYQLIAIANRLALHSNSNAAAMLRSPNFLRNTINAFLLTPIPPTESSPKPVPFALDFLRNLASASREIAAALVEICDALLRFIVSVPPSSPFGSELSTSLLIGTLDLYATLCSYGLYAHAATTAAEHFSALDAYVFSAHCSSYALKAAWVKLVEVWMICARDPHRTTPPHDLLWSQVVGWEWGQALLHARQSLAGLSRGKISKDSLDAWASWWSAQAAYLEGCRVNSPKYEVVECRTVVLAVRAGFETGPENDVVRSALDALALCLDCEIQADSLLSSLEFVNDLFSCVGCLRALLQFTLSCTHSTPDGDHAAPWTGQLLASLKPLVDRLLRHSIWDFALSDTRNARWCTYLRAATELFWNYLRLLRATSGIDRNQLLSLALVCLQRFLPADEAFAYQVIQWIMESIVPPTGTAQAQAQANALTSKQISDLAPFVSYLVSTKEDTFVGPVTPSPDSLQRATTQRLPADCLIRRSGESKLPLSRDWPTSALDHLLRSGSSAVFHALPPSWDASETELVRASLILANKVQDILYSGGNAGFAMSREQMIFACMKVFMLEHGQQETDLNGSSDSQVEVFRDKVVERLMGDLLQPFSFAATQSLDGLPLHTLEDAAKSFLGTATPFYQFYQDFVGLYDSISFAHPLFGLLLLSPTSMRYAIDYRKYLYGDFGHVLRTVQTPIEGILTRDLREYMYPVETSPEMIGWYVRVLVKWAGTGDFVRFVAVHHVASNIWPDLPLQIEQQQQQEGSSSDFTASNSANESQIQGSEDDRRSLLLKAMVNQGSLDIIRCVLTYQQNGSVTLPVLLPPKCFDRMEAERKKGRLELIERWGGEAMRARLSRAFGSS